MLKQSFDSVNLFKKALDASWMKNTTITKNIANINTPGYKREVVEFDSVLKKYLDQDSSKMTLTNEKHIGVAGSVDGLTPKVVKDSDTSFRIDENNVNIDVEMTEFSKNLIKYNAMTQQVSSQLKRIRLAIRDGR